MQTVKSSNHACVFWTAQLTNQPNNLLTNSVQQSPSSEAKSFSAIQIPDILWDLQVHYHVHKGLPLVNVFISTESMHPHPISLRFQYYPPNAQVLQVVSFLQVSPPKLCMHIFSPPYMTHAPPISLSFIWSPTWYLLSSINHKAPHYAISSNLLLLPLS